MGGFCAHDVIIFAAHIVESGMGASRWLGRAKILVVAKAGWAVVSLNLGTHADITVETNVLRNPYAS
jgi:hypothetical protein